MSHPSSLLHLRHPGPPDGEEGDTGEEGAWLEALLQAQVVTVGGAEEESGEEEGEAEDYPKIRGEWLDEGQPVPDLLTRGLDEDPARRG